MKRFPLYQVRFVWGRRGYNLRIIFGSVIKCSPLCIPLCLHSTSREGFCMGHSSPRVVTGSSQREKLESLDLPLRCPESPLHIKGPSRAKREKKTSLYPSAETDKKKGYRKPHWGRLPQHQGARSNHSCPLWWEEAERGRSSSLLALRLKFIFHKQATTKITIS